MNRKSGIKMLSDLVKKLVESDDRNDDDFKDLAKKVEVLSKNLGDLSAAVAQLATIVREHQASIFTITLALSQITNKMKSSGIDTSLPDIKTPNDDEPN